MNPQQSQQGKSSVTTPIGAVSLVEPPITRIPVIVGRNRLRGNGQGAMVEDLDGENLEALRAVLREEARLADVEPTPDWLGKSVSQLLRMYDEDRQAWQAKKDDTVGCVSEYQLPSGRTLLFSVTPMFARFGASIEQIVRDGRQLAA